MALLSPEGRYIRIENIDLNGFITYRIYRDKDQRTKGPWEFELTMQDTCKVPLTTFDSPADIPSMAVSSVMKEKAYIAMKTLEQFEGYTDI